MAGECDKSIDVEKIKSPEKTEKNLEDISDENLLQHVLLRRRPKSKTNEIDPLAEMLSVSIKCFELSIILSD